MFSLYRAWLSLGTTLPPLPVTTHHALSSTNGSGAPDITLQIGPALTHFSAHRGVLCTHSGYFNAILNNHESGPIIVPNINVDEFSSLLTYMYTGFLNLNYANIYHILLATHLLHMPRALEQCRNFLINNTPLGPHTPPPLAPPLLKPIPNRQAPTASVTQILPPHGGLLTKSEHTPFRTVEQRANEPQATPTEGKRAAPRPTKRRGEHKDDKVIIDIACCDGPVRFHRVLNKNYGLKSSSSTAATLMDGELNRDNDDDDNVQPEIDRTLLMNRVMNENIRDQRLEAENRNQGETFTCLYCKHTFKSQYCYQKHARRHLNPISVAVKKKVEGGVTVMGSSDQRREVKLLDMNVQYYPCKTCGSKFPSYYFVHKHRKMCHGEEGGGGNGSKAADGSDNNLIQTAHPDSNTSRSQDSEINVDDVC